MPEVATPIIAAVGLGLMGAGHCMSMCGGIVAALSFAQGDTGKRKYWLHLSYSLGRITTYGLLGGLVAAFSGAVPAQGLPIGRTLAGLLIVAVGLHFLGQRAGVIWVERLGQGVWRRLKPLATAIVPVKRPAQAFAAGAVWGWLPCGLVYSALVYAATQGAFLPGAAVMLAFGAGTLPALLIGGLAASKLQHWFSKQRVRSFVACSYIAFGIWTLFSAWYHASFHQHAADPSAPESMQHQHHH